jgi:proline dehydrogenase
MMHSATDMLRQCAHWLEGHARNHYIAGATVDEAMRQAKALGGRGYAVTLGYWNGRGEEPAQVGVNYHAVLDRIARIGLDGRVSIKVPAISYGRREFEALLEQSRLRRVAVHLDALRPEDAGPTFELLQDYSRVGYQLGCTLPSRWRRSASDADWVVEHGLTVRIVKGQWPDDTGADDRGRARYLALVDRLAGRAGKVLVATHDIPLAIQALDRLLAAGTPCELEILQGLPVKHLLPEAFERCVSVRVYLPFGHGWLPYCLSAVRHNPRIAMWLVRDSLTGGLGYRFPPRPVHSYINTRNSSAASRFSRQ